MAPTRLGVISEKLERKSYGGFLMATAISSVARLQFIGTVLEIAGVGAVAAGVILSLHHWPAAAALIGGGTAFFVGKKFRGQ